jgi:hypothetical protein
MSNPVQYTSLGGAARTAFASGINQAVARLQLPGYGE